ncbi:STAS domain-containing protein [Streptomyces roseolus]|uniref:STAS domain-containing protein n=1 Tax=Streptomyces roseolus TaxID=67358 RepID=UPI00379ABBA2
MSLLKITTRDAATGPVMEIVGDLDHAHAPELRRELDALVLRPGERPVLDLSGMTFCDSSGITAMIAARSRAEASGAGCALAAVPDFTLRVLRIAGLDQIFPLYPDRASATA